MCVNSGLVLLVGFSSHSGVGLGLHEVDVGSTGLPGKKLLADFCACVRVGVCVCVCVCKTKYLIINYVIICGFIRMHYHAILLGCLPIMSLSVGRTRN